MILVSEELRQALHELREAHAANVAELKRQIAQPQDMASAFEALERVELAVRKVVSLLPPEV